MLKTDLRDQRPERLLDGFIEHSATLELVESHTEADRLDAHWFMADCGILFYCSFCGDALCPGCGSGPAVMVTVEGAAATCRNLDCMSEFGKLIGEELFIGRLTGGIAPDVGWRVRNGAG